MQLCYIQSHFAGNSVELLATLPAIHIWTSYLVDDLYANGKFHLTPHTSEIMEGLMLTYGNAEFFPYFLSKVE